MAHYLARPVPPPPSYGYLLQCTASPRSMTRGNWPSQLPTPESRACAGRAGAGVIRQQNGGILGISSGDEKKFVMSKTHHTCYLNTSKLFDNDDEGVSLHSDSDSDHARCDFRT
jgi:hypothetical protein